MKPTFRLVTTLTLAVSAFLGSAQTAQAQTWHQHSGTVCHAWNAADATRVDYFDYGARVLGAASAQVVCPLVRSTTNSLGATADVDIWNNTSQTVSCTLYSYPYSSNTPLGSVTQTWTGLGLHEFSLYLGNLTSNYWSTYSVRCTVPGNGATIIKDIDLGEY
jgi:hypothetical protein